MGQGMFNGLLTSVASACVALFGIGFIAGAIFVRVVLSGG